MWHATSRCGDLVTLPGSATFHREHAFAPVHALILSRDLTATVVPQTLFVTGVGTTNPHIAIRHMVSDVRAALNAKAWFAALALAVALPEICGKLDEPKLSPGARYSRWFDRYLARLYLDNATPPQPMMTGGDCFALRCAVLHEGSDELGAHKAAQVLARFTFAAPPDGAGSVHRNVIYGRGATMLVQVDEFCEEICSAVEAWMSDEAAAFQVSSAHGRALLTVHPYGHIWQALAGARRLFLPSSLTGFDLRCRTL